MKTNTKVIKVKDYTIYPGPGKITNGPKSGEEYRLEVLEPAFLEAVKTKTKLIVDLDGTIGYGANWLQECFGKLAYKYGCDIVINTLELKSDEEPYLIEDILSYMRCPDSTDKV